MTSSEPVCACPELGPDAYARWRASELGAITERLERRLILELAGDVAGRAVLDLGCGDGELALALVKRGALATGIDASPAMIDAARRRAMQQGAEVALQVATAEHLPFPAERFDIVTAITVLCFIDDPAPVLREISRVLRPGGRLVIGELGKWSPWAATRRMRAWFGSALWRRARFRTADDLRDLAAQAGLVVESLRGAIYYPRCAAAARWLSPYDSLWGRFTTLGAGFVALSAAKPGSRRDDPRAGCR